MKSFKLFPVLLFLTACGSGIPKYDATGTFEATDVIVSAEATGRYSLWMWKKVQH